MILSEHYPCRAGPALSQNLSLSVCRRLQQAEPFTQSGLAHQAPGCGAERGAWGGQVALAGWGSGVQFWESAPEPPARDLGKSITIKPREGEECGPPRAGSQTGR